MGSGLFAFELQRQYIVNKADYFQSEYEAIRGDPNFYHGLHEQVALGYNDKQQIAKE